MPNSAGAQGARPGPDPPGTVGAAVVFEDRAVQQLLDSDVPEDPYLSKELVRYFPKPLQERYANRHAAAIA
jgi:hypothetical protein